MSDQSDDGNFVLRWDLHKESRTSTLKSLWKNEDFLDVTIACDDDQIDAHKVILSAASPFFHKILKRNPHSHPLIYLRGTTKKDVQSLLNFIYSGETQVLQEELEDFMALANSLEVKGLVGEPLMKEDENSVKSSSKLDQKKTESRINTKMNKSGTKKKHYAESSTIFEEKKPTFTNDKTSREKDLLLTENLQMVELTEEISEHDNEFYISDNVERYGSAEDNDSFQSQNASNTSLTEYDERVSELVTKTENVWSCAECQYSSKNKNHVKEHVESHIEGYSHECRYCDKTFEKKQSLRKHKNKCIKAFNF